MGAKTRAPTPGKKRARKFLDLKFESELRPTAAASAVADEFSVTTDQIFKDAKRHEQTIANDIWEEAQELKHQLEMRRAIYEMGPHQPRDIGVFIGWVMSNAFKGYSL